MHLALNSTLDLVLMFFEADSFPPYSCHINGLQSNEHYKLVKNNQKLDKSSKYALVIFFKYVSFSTDSSHHLWDVNVRNLHYNKLFF